MDHYDLAVIGGGTAGLVAAAGGALLGARVILFERAALGGDCLWTGCVPTKALIRSARVYRDARRGAEYGLPALDAPADFARVMERMRRVRAAIEPHDSPERFRSLGVDVVLETARLRGPERVSSETRDVRARRVLLATGTRSAAPPIPGLEQTGYLTHMEALERDELAASLVILGGGPIGLEFAQLYARFGARVTVLEREAQLLPLEDAELAAALRRVLENEGIEVVTGAHITRAERRADGTKAVHAGARSFVGDELFVATGRRPNVEGLGLEAAGVATSSQGIVVDEHLRTTRRGVYAAGDITGKYLFTHVADYQARLVVANALVPLVRRRADYTAVPWVTFTDPELARIGLTESQARARHGDAVQVFRFPLDDFDRALIDGETSGLVKLVADRRGRLLGAHILARAAGSLIAECALALRAGLRVTEIANTIHAYPTMPEAVRKAAEVYYRSRLEGWGGRLLRRLVRWRSVR